MSKLRARSSWPAHVDVIVLCFLLYVAFTGRGRQTYTRLPSSASYAELRPP